MSSYVYPPHDSAQNLQFYPSSYPQHPVSGHTTPFQAAGSSHAYINNGFGFGSRFPAQPGVSGKIGEESNGLTVGWLAAFGTEGYEGEPPLLEELGVNFGHIKAKTFAVLNPLARIDQHLMDDADLAGPFLFCILFGFCLLFSGNLHFGYIFGLAGFGSGALWALFSFMSPFPSPTDLNSIIQQQQYHEHPSNSSSIHPAVSSTSALTFLRSTSVLGYCILPLVFTSIPGIALNMDAPIGYLITTLAIFWCTYSSSAIFCTVGRMTQMRLLVAYPLALFYVGFGIMAIFSSRGSGALAKTAAAAATQNGLNVVGKSF